MACSAKVDTALLCAGLAADEPEPEPEIPTVREPEVAEGPLGLFRLVERAAFWAVEKDCFVVGFVELVIPALFVTALLDVVFVPVLTGFALVVEVLVGLEPVVSEVLLAAVLLLVVPFVVVVLAAEELG